MDKDEELMNRSRTYKKVIQKEVDGKWVTVYEEIFTGRITLWELIKTRIIKGFK